MSDEYGNCDICSQPLDPDNTVYKAHHGSIVCSLTCVHEAETEAGRSRLQWTDIWEALDPENLEGHQNEEG